MKTQRKKQNRTKYSLIEPIADHGGMEVYDIRLCLAVKHLGYDVTWYTSNNTGPYSSKLGNNNVKSFFGGIYSPRLPAVLRGLLYCVAVLRVCSRMRITGCRIGHVFIFDFSSAELLLLSILKLFGIRVIATVHDIEPFRYYGKSNKISYNNFFRKVDVFAGTNEYSNRLLRKIYPGVESSVVNPTNVGFRYKKVPQELSRKKVALPTDDKIVLFFGQIKKVKGLEVFLRAIKKVKKHNRVKFVVTGKLWKNNWEAYQNIIESDEIANRIITRLGYVPNELVFHYYNSADVIVLPYKRIFNSSILLEAIQYCVPIIASDIPYFEEAIEDGKTGILFKSEDADDLADKINKVLEKPETITKLRENLKALSAAQYSIDAVGRQMRVVLDKLI